MHQTKSSSRTDAPVTALTSPKISYYRDHVTIRLPNGVWNEALQEQAQSANIRPDPKAVADLITSERSQPDANRSTATGARPVLHSDSRDAIPLTYYDNTRHIISVVGFIVSSATILGVHLAGNDGKVPGFQPLPLYDGDRGEIAATWSGPAMLAVFGSTAIAVTRIITFSCKYFFED
jgi:hypothetical protein